MTKLATFTPTEIPALGDRLRDVKVSVLHKMQYGFLWDNGQYLRDIPFVRAVGGGGMSDHKSAEAVKNLASGINVTARLPDRVFAREFASIYVMDFRKIFSPRAVKLFKFLMALESADTLAFACFQQSPVIFPDRQGQVKDWNDDVFLMSSEAEEDAFWSFFDRNDLEYGLAKATLEMRPPWFIYGEVVGACTDLGTWCIYCEKYEEIALLGFKTQPGILVEKQLYADYRIEKLSDALQRNTFFGEPHNDLSRQWCAKLLSAYNL